MKFCPECGSQLPAGAAKFCSNCGKSLWATTSETSITVQPIEDTSPQPSVELGKEIHGEFQNQTIHSLGIKLETVEQILKSKNILPK